MLNTDAAFTGSISQAYEQHLVQFLFAPYARDLATRVAGMSVNRVLEIAAGTGAVTRELAAVLPASVAIVATDLNQSMLDEAAAAGTARPVEWRQADAMALPFGDAEFDAVVCQFGVMFLPERAAGYAEMRRVLRPRGMLVFNVWDSLEHNEIAQAVSDAVVTLFPKDPPLFLARTPYGYHDTAHIARDLGDGGFAKPPHVDTVSERSRAPSALSASMGFCEGTPLRTEIEARDSRGVTPTTNEVARVLARTFGTDAIDARMQAKIVSVQNDA